MIALALRLATAAALVLTVAGCGVKTTTSATINQAASATPTTTASTASRAATASTASNTSAPVFFEGAAGGRRQHPSSLLLTADGTLEVSGVQWTAWGGPTATGTGNASYHGCNPNCAAAPSHSAVVSIRLGDVRTCSGHSYYSSVTLTMNSGKLLDESFLQRSWSPC